MTDERWISGDAELTNALRALYAAPADAEYWAVLEARILAHVASAHDTRSWWSEVVEMARPGLAAAAALIFAAGIALMHSRQAELTRAYSSVITPTPTSLETSSRASSVGDGDAAIHELISR